jgi:hypothetical protein
METKTENQDSDQILIKMENSPYYVVQPPQYDWDHPDTKADIDYQMKLFNSIINKDAEEPKPGNGPKLLEPWRYRLASQYNHKYNEENGINPFHHSYSSSDEENEENEENEKEKHV